MTLLRDDDLARAFDHASHTYDRLTALNPGYRTDLLRSARRLRLADGGAGRHLLDLGCGTGASTRALLRAAPRARITAARIRVRVGPGLNRLTRIGVAAVSAA